MVTKQKKKLKTKNDKKKYIKRARRALTLQMIFFIIGIPFYFCLPYLIACIILDSMNGHSMSKELQVFMLSLIIIFSLIFIANTITTLMVRIKCKIPIITRLAIIYGIITILLSMWLAAAVTPGNGNILLLMGLSALVLVIFCNPWTIIAAVVLTILEMKYVIPKGGFSKRDLIVKPPRIPKKTRKARNTNSNQDDEEI